MARGPKYSLEGVHASPGSIIGCVKDAMWDLDYPTRVVNAWAQEARTIKDFDELIKHCQAKLDELNYKYIQRNIRCL